MIKLLPIYLDSIYLNDILTLILHYGGLVFSEIENPVDVFLKTLSENKIKVIGAICNNKLIAFVAFYNFKKINCNNFFCYMYGMAKSNTSQLIDASLKYILRDLKSKGCIFVRCETRKYNMPMRFMANRLKFRKVGILEKASFVNGNFIDNILYEKIL